MSQLPTVAKGTVCSAPLPEALSRVATAGGGGTVVGGAVLGGVVVSGAVVSGAVVSGAVVDGASVEGELVVGGAVVTGEEGGVAAGTEVGARAVV